MKNRNKEVINKIGERGKEINKEGDIKRSYHM